MKTLFHFYFLYLNNPNFVYVTILMSKFLRPGIKYQNVNLRKKLRFYDNLNNTWQNSTFTRKFLDPLFRILVIKTCILV